MFTWNPFVLLFWWFSLPKQGLFQSKQGSFGFQVHISCPNKTFIKIHLGVSFAQRKTTLSNATGLPRLHHFAPQICRIRDLMSGSPVNETAEVVEGKKDSLHGESGESLWNYVYRYYNMCTLEVQDQTKWLVFRMIHSFRIPDPTKGPAVWSTWLPEKNTWNSFILCFASKVNGPFTPIKKGRLSKGSTYYPTEV